MAKFWNDTETPLAYLITIRTYGTWLPGDERGSIDRFHNIYRGPRVPVNPVLEQQARAKLKSDPLILDARKRKAVKDAILEVCENREWFLRAINVRTNHALAPVVKISQVMTLAVNYVVTRILHIGRCP